MAEKLSKDRVWTALGHDVWTPERLKEKRFWELAHQLPNIDDLPLMEVVAAQVCEVTGTLPSAFKEMFVDERLPLLERTVAFIKGEPEPLDVPAPPESVTFNNVGNVSHPRPRKKRTPTNVARDQQFMEWSQSGLNAGEIAAKWNLEHRDDVSDSTVRKALSRLRKCDKL